MQTLVLLFAFALLSCSCSIEPQEEPIVLVKENPKSLGQIETNKLRHPESLRRYAVGRYVDPSNRMVMHEAHDLYRIETTRKWKHRPQRGISLLSKNNSTLNPPSSTSQEVAQLKRALSHEREATRAAITANQQMRQQLTPLTEAVKKAKVLIDQNAQLRLQLQNIQTNQPQPIAPPKSPPEEKPSPKPSLRKWLESADE